VRPNAIRDVSSAYWVPAMPAVQRLDKIGDEGDAAPGAPVKLSAVMAKVQHDDVRGPRLRLPGEHQVWLTACRIPATNSDLKIAVAARQGTPPARPPRMVEATPKVLVTRRFPDQ